MFLLLLFFSLKHSSVFSFCLTFFASMKLRGTIICPGLEIISLFGSILMQSAHALVGGLDLKCTQAVSSPRVFWQPPSWWKVGLELERLVPEPGATQAYSYAQVL